MSIASIPSAPLFSPLLAQGLSALTLLNPNPFHSLLEQNTELSHSMTEHEPQIAMPPSQDNIIQASLLFAMQRTPPMQEEIEEKEQEETSSEDDASFEEDMPKHTSTNLLFIEALFREKAEKFILYFEEELRRNGGHVRNALEYARHTLSGEITLSHEELHAIVQSMVTEYAHTAKETATHALHAITRELLLFIADLEETMENENPLPSSRIPQAHVLENLQHDYFFTNELLMKSTFTKNTTISSTPYSSL